jgi:hypothetical protein
MVEDRGGRPPTRKMALESIHNAKPFSKECENLPSYVRAWEALDGLSDSKHINVADIYRIRNLVEKVFELGREYERKG